SVAISRHGDHRAVHSFPTRRSSYRPFGKTDAEEVRRDAQADVGRFAAHPPPPSARTAIDRPPRPPRSAGFRVLPPPLSLAPVPRPSPAKPRRPPRRRAHRRRATASRRTHASARGPPRASPPASRAPPPERAPPPPPARDRPGTPRAGAATLPAANPPPAAC